MFASTFNAYHQSTYPNNNTPINQPRSASTIVDTSSSGGIMTKVSTVKNDLATLPLPPPSIPIKSQSEISPNENQSKIVGKKDPAEILKDDIINVVNALTPKDKPISIIFGIEKITLHTTNKKGEFSCKKIANTIKTSNHLFGEKSSDASDRARILSSVKDFMNSVT